MKTGCEPKRNWPVSKQQPTNQPVPLAVQNLAWLTVNVSMVIVVLPI